MDIEKIAAKLEPLMPDTVKYWLRVRETSDADIRSLIEKQIISTAYDKLGDFHKKILLSLPSEKNSKGAINLGSIQYESGKWPCGISTSELLQNMAILGRSGAGKTNVGFHILKQLADRKIPFIFLDWKRTMRHLLLQIKAKINIYTAGRPLAKFPFNPFVVPPGVESNVYVNQVVDVMADAFTLGEGSMSLMRKAISTLYASNNLCPTVKEIITEVEKIPDKERVRSWKITALRALESLEFSQTTSGNRITQSQLAEKFLTENTVIELDALSQESKQFLVPMVCLWLYYVRLESPEREKLKLVIFIEEAHHVLHKRDHRAKESVLEMLFRQCRELGIGIIVLDQHPHLLSVAALGNVFTTICLNQKDPMDINKAAAVSLVDSDEKNIFSMLSVGQGIVKLQDRWTKPFLVKFPLVDVKKGLMTDDMLARYFAQNNRRKTGSMRNTSETLEFERVPRVPMYDIALDDGEIYFMEDVLAYPDDGVKARYKRLGFGVGSGNRIKEKLLEQGWLETQTVVVGRTRTVLLRLTQQAKKALGVESDQPQRGSILHEYWKNFYAQRFRDEGYKVILEAPRNSGNVDVLAVKDGKRIAIEIETGKSDILQNVRQNLLSGFENILIVATDIQAFKKVETELAKAGLLGIKKIQVVLKDGACRDEF